VLDLIFNEDSVGDNAIFDLFTFMRACNHNTTCLDSTSFKFCPQGRLSNKSLCNETSLFYSPVSSSSNINIVMNFLWQYFFISIFLMSYKEATVWRLFQCHKGLSVTAHLDVNQLGYMVLSSCESNNYHGFSSGCLGCCNDRSC